jgi:hypothetical protein
MYHLQDESPLIGAGYNGADIGAYGMVSGEIGPIGTIDQEGKTMILGLLMSQLQSLQTMYE